MLSRVSIVGAGPAGLALAADLQSHGISALMYSHPDHPQHANRLRDNGRLRVSGVMEGFTDLELTTDMAEIIAFSHIVVLAVPSTGQETVLKELKPFDLRQHTIVAIPGNLFSLTKAAGIKVGNILETNLSPYSCRMDDGKLLVLGRKRRIFIGALHNEVSADFYEDVQRVFPFVELKWCHSVVEVCLSNVNGVFHPLMMLMNAGRIESTAGDFLLYAEGLTRSVANAMQAVDRVRMQIAAAFGFRLRSAVDISNDCYGQRFTDLVDLARHSPPHRSLRSPADMAHRNISEDVPDLLVCWHGLAEKLGIDASPIRAVIVLVEMATGVNYMETGRNMKRLNLENVSRSELVARFGPCLVTHLETRL
ncbi:6-phosphogluconate dehydrogenase C-terminal domain-like protein [Coniochaeta ligniaria NRRL 30616]|uniref:6-phosphogluconate dehydrogenase C-terminal domain-like protein n=1 Tax=Coniochaeta ligniaria NRRL 30616 TaxID=1408157 RepID=A0A1J7J5Z7_9PEZI|nr:6-phosphogluconate dehydrogenase C-terminal domain-like protein [Coniochaeta ligniaria NRRL 30616]